MPFKFSASFPYIKKKIYNDAYEEGPVQRVIVPQGLVNPHELTIIEIPQNLQDSPAVIAKPRADDESYSNFFPVAYSSVKDSQSFPKTTRSRFPEMYESGVSYGGSPNQSETVYRDYIEDYSSIVGPYNEETGYDYSDPEGRTRGFDRQFSQYTNMEPARSTPEGYRQSEDSYPDTLDYSSEEPQQTSYYLVPNQPLNYNSRNRTTNIEGGRIYGRSETTSPQSGLKKVLDNLDVSELSRIKNDLRNFQLARRKLLFDASKLKH